MHCEWARLGAARTGLAKLLMGMHTAYRPDRDMISLALGPRLDDMSGVVRLCLNRWLAGADRQIDTHGLLPEADSPDSDPSRSCGRPPRLEEADPAISVPVSENGPKPDLDGLPNGPP
jgi:hypothetical protein